MCKSVQMWRGNFDTMEQKFSNIYIFWWSNNSSRKMLICVHKDWSTIDVCYSSLCVCVYAKSLQCVWLFATLWTVACQAPLSMRILQTRILEWVAMPFSRRSSQPGERTHVSCVAGGFITTEPPGGPMYRLHVGSSPTRYQSLTPCTGSSEAYPLLLFLFSH